MKIYDVSMEIFEGMAVYNEAASKQPKLTTKTNGHVTESRIDMDLHTGTHVDSPLHMINDGETMDSIPVEDLVGKVKVFDVTHVEDRIRKADIESFSIERDDFIIFKTKNSFEEGFNFEFVFVGEDAAEYLAELGIKGVGLDGLGIERDQDEHPTHRTLFRANVIVMEGLRLADVPEGEYLMVGAPLKIMGKDASPARVLLLDGVRY